MYRCIHSSKHFCGKRETYEDSDVWFYGNLCQFGMCVPTRSNTVVDTHYQECGLPRCGASWAGHWRSCFRYCLYPTINTSDGKRQCTSECQTCIIIVDGDLILCMYKLYCYIYIQASLANIKWCIIINTELIVLASCMHYSRFIGLMNTGERRSTSRRRNQFERR